eukprot:COSAG02_NODE_3654_length_6410_cov_11.576929_3_plen_101_part_00
MRTCSNVWPRTDGRAENSSVPPWVRLPVSERVRIEPPIPTGPPSCLLGILSRTSYYRYKASQRSAREMFRYQKSHQESEKSVKVSAQRGIRDCENSLGER